MALLSPSASSSSWSEWNAHLAQQNRCYKYFLLTLFTFSSKTISQAYAKLCSLKKVSRKMWTWRWLKVNLCQKVDELYSAKSSSTWDVPLVRTHIRPHRLHETYLNILVLIIKIVTRGPPKAVLRSSALLNIMKKTRLLQLWEMNWGNFIKKEKRKYEVVP